MIRPIMGISKRDYKWYIIQVYISEENEYLKIYQWRNQSL